HQLIQQVVEQTCTAFGAKGSVEIPKGYPSLFNDPAFTQKASDWARDFLGAGKVEELDLRMTADDFAFFSQEMPGCYFRLGTNRNHEAFTASVHNAHFDIDESAMVTGVGLMTWLALQSLVSESAR